MIIINIYGKICKFCDFMYKKILYVSLFVLIFLLAVQSVSASDTNLNDINSNDFISDDYFSFSGEEDSLYDSLDLDNSLSDDKGDEISSDVENMGDEEESDIVSDVPEEDNRIESVIIADSTSFDYSSDGKMEINLKDVNGFALSNKTICLKNDQIQENLITDDDGKAIFRFSGDVGIYGFDISFEGDELYAPSSTNAKMTIVKSSTKLTVPSVRGYMSKSTYVIATLADSKGAAIANRNISVIIGGVSYYGTTDSNGKAKVKIPNKVGNFTASVKFNGDKNYLASSASSKVVITKMKTSLFVPEVKSYLTQNTYLTITLKNVFGIALANKIITVKVAKKTYNLTSNAKGVAKLKFDKKLGTYNCTVKFKETGTFYGASKAAKVTISKMPTKIKAPAITYNSNKYAKFLINLTDINGKGLKNKTISVYISSIKKLYKLKTNESGVAILKFNGPKTYNLTVNYAGGKYYVAKKVKSQLIVKKIKISFNDIVGASVLLKDYVSKNKALPSTISYKQYNFTTAQLSYLMSVAVNHANNNNKNDIVLIAVSAPKDSKGEIYDTVYKKDYLKIAKKSAGSSINHKTPSYIAHSIYNVPFKVYTAEFSRALSFYKENKRLPKYVLFTNSEFVKVKDNGKYTFYLTTDNIRGKRSDLKMLKSLRKTLQSKGYNAVIVGIGPDIHNIAYKYGCTGKNSVLLAVFGGVDVGCIEEWTGELKNHNRNFVTNYEGAHVLGLWFTKPYGASSSIYHKIGRAWDADYGRPLSNPAKYMSQHGISYIQTGTVSSACTKLEQGKMGGPKLIK